MNQNVAGNSLVCSSIALYYCSCSQPLLKQTLGPSPSTVHLCRRWKHTTILKMVIIYILYVLCLLYLLFCFGRMVEVDWISDCIGAWPRKASTLCHPWRAYPGKTSSCASWWYRPGNDSAPPAQLVSRRTWRQQAWCWRRLAMYAVCGLSTRGQWRGPVTCNEWEGELDQCLAPYTTLMCRFVPTFIITFMAIIAIMCPKIN